MQADERLGLHKRDLYMSALENNTTRSAGRSSSGSATAA